MDEQELAAIAARHQEDAPGCTSVCTVSVGGGHVTLDQPWPCDAAKLAQEVRRLRTAIREIEHYAAVRNDLGLSLTITQATEVRD